MKRAEKEQFRHAESDYFIDSAELSAGGWRARLHCSEFLRLGDFRKRSRQRAHNKQLKSDQLSGSMLQPFSLDKTMLRLARPEVERRIREHTMSGFEHKRNIRKA